MEDCRLALQLAQPRVERRFERQLQLLGLPEELHLQAVVEQGLVNVAPVVSVPRQVVVQAADVALQAVAGPLVPFVLGPVLVVQAAAMVALGPAGALVAAAVEIAAAAVEIAEQVAGTIEQVVETLEAQPLLSGMLELQAAPPYQPIR